jgi:hypothetical protein
MMNVLDNKVDRRIQKLKKKGEKGKNTKQEQYENLRKS